MEIIYKSAKLISFLTFLGILASCSLKAQSIRIDNIQASDSVSIRADFNKYFKDYNVLGSIAIYDNAHKKWIFSDSADVYKEALPASSFKIINFLIALETGVVKDENEVIKWNGQMDTARYGYRPEIYRDMTVQEAFSESAVWVFLDLAKKIGRTNYQYYLKICKYGNQNLSEPGDDFWNFGYLGISPVNQVDFLKNLYFGKLPFSKRNIDIVKRVMITEQNADYTIRAKTGWTREGGINTGWWVGDVENKQGVFFFATRIFQDRKFNSPDFGPCRKEITKSIFNDIGIIRRITGN
jgi:beta-lactamase class D